jgi:hypothetical protein
VRENEIKKGGDGRGRVRESEIKKNYKKKWEKEK